MTSRQVKALVSRLQRRGMGVSYGRETSPAGYLLRYGAEVWFSAGGTVSYQVARFALASDAREFLAMKRKATP